MSTVDVRSKYLIEMVMARMTNSQNELQKKVKKENRFSLTKKKKKYIL